MIYSYEQKFASEIDPYNNNRTIVFVYDNVQYQFDGYNCSAEEMLAVIEQMK